MLFRSLVVGVGDGSCQGCACKAEPTIRTGWSWPWCPPSALELSTSWVPCWPGVARRAQPHPGLPLARRRAGLAGVKGRPQGAPAGTRSALDAGRSGVAPARPARIGGQVAGCRGPREPARSAAADPRPWVAPTLVAQDTRSATPPGGGGGWRYGMLGDPVLALVVRLLVLLVVLVLLAAIVRSTRRR